VAPRSLASLAHALGATSDLDGALIALADTVAELDRGAAIAMFRYDGRREMLRERLTPVLGRVERSAVETTFDHLPTPIRLKVAAGGQFVDVSDRTADYVRLFGFTHALEGGVLSLRGLRVEGYLAAVLALYEPRKIFGTRTTERLAPALSLFDLAFGRLSEREAREEAVRTLEDVTQRVHGEYVRRLQALESELREVRNTTPQGVPALSPAEVVALQAESARAEEEVRRAARKADLSEQQLMSAVGQLEQAHVELHRRSEALRQRTRTLYLLDRVLTLDASTTDSSALADGLLALVGDDMQAQRCSLMLVAPEPEQLYLAAGRGLSPDIPIGMRIRIGEGVAGRVAASREPMLVQDVAQADRHPLLRDQYFTTGSFISFPLVYHTQLVGVVNLTNRAKLGVYTEEDVERVRLLALVISLVASNARLPERLSSTLDVG
jgi:putative methionine-R-sulfoxide reductase with GAF domain